MSLSELPRKRKKSPESTPDAEFGDDKARKVQLLSFEPDIDPASKTSAPADAIMAYTVDVPGVGVLDGCTAPPFGTMQMEHILNPLESSGDRTRADPVEDTSPRNHTSHLPSLVTGSLLPIDGDCSPHVLCDSPMSSVHNSALTSLDDTSSPFPMKHKPRLLSLGAASTERPIHALRATKSMPNLPQDTQYSNSTNTRHDKTLYVSRDLHADMQHAFERIAHPPSSGDTIFGALTYYMAKSVDVMNSAPLLLPYGQPPSTSAMSFAAQVMARCTPTSYDPNYATSSNI